MTINVSKENTASAFRVETSWERSMICKEAEEILGTGYRSGQPVKEKEIPGGH
jgi:hypothetical protein